MIFIIKDFIQMGKSEEKPTITTYFQTVKKKMSEAQTYCNLTIDSGESKEF